MANLTTIDFRKGEVGPIGVTFEVISGSDGEGIVTSISSDTRFSLIDSQSNPVTGFDNVSGCIAELNSDGLGGVVKFNLDTRLPVLPCNLYYANFFIVPTATDSVFRITNADVQVRILPMVEKIATYDPLTVRGRLRLEMQDISDFSIPGTAIGITDAVHTDAEVDLFLSQVKGNLIPTASNTGLSNADLYQACFYAWMNIAANKANNVKVKKILFIQSSTMPTYQAAVQQANLYQKMSNQEAGVVTTDPTGSPGVCDGCYDEFGHYHRQRIDEYWPHRRVW